MNLVKSADRLVDRAARVGFVLLIILVPWSIAPMTIAAVACSVFTVIRWLRPPRPRVDPTPVGGATLAWMAALVLSACFAFDPAASFSRLGKGLLPALVPVVAFHARDRKLGQRALLMLLLSSALAALSGTLFFWESGASLSSRARGPTGHYMTFGGQLLLLGSVAAGVVWGVRPRPWKWWGLGAWLPIVLALALTLTRSAWLGFAASMAVILGRTRPRWLLLLGAALVAGALLAPPTFRDRLTSAFQPGHANNVERTYMWQAGWKMFLDRPLTGVGIQDLKPYYPRYRPAQATQRAGHLHSVPVQIAATMGVVGLAAFAWLFGSLLYAAGSPPPPDGGVAGGLRVGVLGGLVGFLVAGLFEWNFGDEELLYLLYTLVGLAWGARFWERAPREESGAS